MMTGEFPTDDEVRWLSREWMRRSVVPDHVIATIDSMDDSIHPMTQFSIAIMAMQCESLLFKNIVKECQSPSIGM